MDFVSFDGTEGYSVVVLLHFHSAELAINETELYETTCISQKLDVERIGTLFASLNAIKSWFDVFFTIPTAEYVSLTFAIMSQLVRCLMVLYKLSTLSDPAWDRDLACQTADLPNILQMVVSNLQAVDGSAGIQDDSPEGTVFIRTANKFELMRLRCVERLGLPLVGPTTENAASAEAAIDLSDMSWFSEIFASP